MRLHDHVLYIAVMSMYLPTDVTPIDEDVVLELALETALAGNDEAVLESACIYIILLLLLLLLCTSSF